MKKYGVRYICIALIKNLAEWFIWAQSLEGDVHGHLILFFYWKSRHGNTRQNCSLHDRYKGEGETDRQTGRLTDW